MMTLHVLNDVAYDAGSTQKSIITSRSVVWRVKQWVNWYTEYKVRVFWYQIHQARLCERMLPSKLDIKRHSPSILYLTLTDRVNGWCFTLSHMFEAADYNVWQSVIFTNVHFCYHMFILNFVLLPNFAWIFAAFAYAWLIGKYLYQNTQGYLNTTPLVFRACTKYTIYTVNGVCYSLVCIWNELFTRLASIK